MSRSLAISLAITDILFLIYWSVSGLVLLGVMDIPMSYLYANYDQPMVVAWNWSYLGVDLAFSFLGLAAVRAARKGNPIWRPLALLSLAFTMAAGGMAVSYWTIMGEYNWSWYLPNLLLVVWPLFFLPGLIMGTAQEQQPKSAI